MFEKKELFVLLLSTIQIPEIMRLAINLIVMAIKLVDERKSSFKLRKSTLLTINRVYPKFCVNSKTGVKN